VYPGVDPRVEAHDPVEPDAIAKGDVELCVSGKNQIRAGATHDACESFG